MGQLRLLRMLGPCSEIKGAREWLSLHYLLGCLVFITFSKTHIYSAFEDINPNGSVNSPAVFLLNHIARSSNCRFIRDVQSNQLHTSRKILLLQLLYRRFALLYASTAQQDMFCAVCQELTG